MLTEEQFARIDRMLTISMMVSEQDTRDLWGEVKRLKARFALAEEVCEGMDTFSKLVPGSRRRIAAWAELERLFETWRHAREADEATEKPNDGDKG